MAAVSSARLSGKLDRTITIGLQTSVQTDRAGGLSNYDGAGLASDPDMYDLEAHMISGSNWESYFWLGGPGA